MCEDVIILVHFMSSHEGGQEGGRERERERESTVHVDKISLTL